MPKKPIFRWIGIVVIAAIVIVLLSLLTQIEDWKRDLSTNVASLNADSPDPRLRPPVLPQSPAEVTERIVAWAEQTPLWAVESSDVGDDTATIHLTRTTRIFRWVDDIHVSLSAVEGGTQVDAESRSRVGKGDLGQNPRNLRTLVLGIGADR